MHASEFIELVTQGEEPAALRALAAAPALATVRNDQGVSVLCLSVYRRLPQLTSALRAGLPALDVHEACCVGDIARVEALLEVDPGLLEAVSADGFRPLGYAAFFGHVELVRKLAQRGAAVDAPSENAMAVRALHSAAATSDDDAAVALTAILLEHGAKPDVQQRGGFTPLHEAALRGHLPLLRLLLGAGADPAVENDAGKTPLHLARTNGHGEAAALLVGDAG